MRSVPPPFPWRHAVLVDGEPPRAGTAEQRFSPARRMRLLDTGLAALGALGEAVRMVGGEAVIGDRRQGEGSGAPVADGWLVGSDALLRKAAARVAPQHRDLVAAVTRALDGFGGGRPARWLCGDHSLDLSGRPLVMGVLNVTPDSFSDGGRAADPGAAEEMAWRMAEDGADILDIGGESTRPGSHSIPASEELSRILPVLDRLSGRLPIPISVDTSKAEVAAAALDRGASILNDITALRGDPEMRELAAKSRAGVVLMHMQGEPATMQDHPHYEDLVREVFLFLHRRVRACAEAGISPERIAVDPGIGFGKTADHNLCLLDRLREFTSPGLPVLVGPSRKGFLGRILNLPVEDRVEGTLAAAVTASLNGASVIRVHDVKPVVRAIRVAASIMEQRVPTTTGVSAS